MHPELRFVHFNDIYHIPSLDLLSRFMHLRQSFIDAKPSNALTIFSGDAFSPSLEASVLKGEHMGPVLDFAGVDIGCYGNHDFDFGDARLIELSRQVRFPWVLSNAFHLSGENQKPDENALLASAKNYVIRTLEGVRIGFFGLAGTDWPSNCEDLPPCHIASPVEVAQRLARHLRVNEGCDVVIALTHMRLAEDMEVADATAAGDCRVDLLLGGHDHEVARRFAGEKDTNPEIAAEGLENDDIFVNGLVRDTEGDIRIIKSGTDWRGMSLVRMIVQRNDGVVTSTIKLKQYYDIEAAVPASSPSPRASEMLDSIHSRVGALVQNPVLHTAVPLDGTGTTVRSQETNLGNMLADAVRAFFNTDIALFNSGAIRCDRILDATVNTGKPLRVRDIINICPFENALVVKQISGEVLFHALENSVSDMHTDGRFLQMSGLRITASWEREQGSRILEVLLDRPNACSEKLDPSKMYTVAMAGFIARGFDGYTWFREEETVVGEEAGMTDTGLALQIFGHGEGLENPAESSSSHHAIGIERAQKTTIVGKHPADQLPIVSPVVDGRIRFVEGAV